MSNVIDFQHHMLMDDFINHSILNDNKISSGLLRLNRFIGVMDVPDIKALAPYLQHNTEIGKNTTQFLSWEIFKIDVPALRLGVESKEVDMMPRMYYKNWEYDDLAVSYLESSDLKIRHFFFEWMLTILDSNTFKRAYYDDIRTKQFRVYPLNYQGQGDRYEVFTDLAPYDVSSINYDVSDEGTNVVLTTVKFKYTKHQVLTV